MVRSLSMLTVLLAALVVVSLPGTTSTSSVLPAPPRALEAALAPIQLDVPSERMLNGAEPSPILLNVLFEDLVRGPERATMPWSGPRALATPPVFAQAQIVSVYGYPGICFMGELGCHAAEAAADRAQALAAEYDAANGERGVVPALHLIVDVAQPRQGPDGTYLYRMGLDDLYRYVEVVRSRGLLLFVDLQVGWSDPLSGVERLRAVLQEPFVHLALDPEFATRPKGEAPGAAIGTLAAVDVNRVQAYLAELVQLHHLPPKVLVLHQFQPGMLTNKTTYAHHTEVAVTVDMDGFGGREAKLSGYEAYARVDSQFSAFKLFFHWDAPLLTARELLALPHPPDYVIYQ